MDVAKVKFSSDIEEMRGKIDKRVYTRARNGATVRSTGTRTTATTPAQSQSQQYFRQANTTFKSLTVSQIVAWANYGAMVKKRDPITGEVYTQTANMAFAGLGSKYLQINAGGTIPVAPPAGVFGGDTIKVTATAGGGKITYTADKANGTDIKTELLIQKLVSKARRSYVDKYKTGAFVAFATGSLSSVVNVTPGVYAVAYRFVNVKTGQETALVPLGNVDAS